mmetsp:Transcript_84006/g.158146  ORF Transcript_84006/g.158146 Transcript_84006/m.158146 type:complete len:212 (-) Transcript_84006:136-771(-)
MALMNTGSLVIVDVVLERPHEQVQLKTQTQQRPILEGKLQEERLAVTDVTDVLDSIDVNGRFLLLFTILRLWLTLSLALILLGLAFLLLLSRLRGSHLHRIRLELLLLDLPILQILLPFTEFAAEPFGRLQIFHSKRDLFLSDPLLQILLGLNLRIPFVDNLIEALFLVRHGELGERRTQCRGREVSQDAISLGQEEDLRLLLIQLSLGRL